MTLNLRYKMDGGKPSSIKATLTTEHPQSSYGMPVMVSPNGTVWGAADGNNVTTAARLILGWIGQNPNCSDDEYNTCRRYLSANPDGKQLPHRAPRGRVD